MACKKLLNMIIEAMKDEKHDAKKYHKMMKMTNNPTIRDQIRFAYEDEKIHYKLFRRLYFELSGKWINVATPPVKLEKTLIGNVKTSIDGELAAVEFYGKIYDMLSKKSQRDTLFKIIMDEQEHATRFVYIYAILTP
jgi:Rubrerythrin.